MQIGTYHDGRPVEYDEPHLQFYIGGVPVSLLDLRTYDAMGRVNWFMDEQHAWFKRLDEVVFNSEHERVNRVAAAQQQASRLAQPQYPSQAQPQQQVAQSQQAQAPHMQPQASAQHAQPHPSYPQQSAHHQAQPGYQARQLPTDAYQNTHYPAGVAPQGGQPQPPGVQPQTPTASGSGRTALIVVLIVVVVVMLLCLVVSCGLFSALRVSDGVYTYGSSNWLGIMMGIIIG